MTTRREIELEIQICNMKNELLTANMRIINYEISINAGHSSRLQNLYNEMQVDSTSENPKND